MQYRVAPLLTTLLSPPRGDARVGSICGLHTREAEAELPEAMCPCCSMGVSGASSALLYTSPCLSHGHVLPPALSALPAVPSSLHMFLFPLQLEDCLTDHTSAHIQLARCPFSPHFFPCSFILKEMVLSYMH